MGYNLAKMKMKKMFFSLFILLTMGMFGLKNVQANAVIIAGNNNFSLSEINGYPTVEVYNVDATSNPGKITVTVKVYNGEPGTTYRIKVTPTKQWLEKALVDSSMHVEVTTWKNNGDVTGTAEVTFTCTETKNGDAAYCSLYDFHAEIVRR